MSTQASFTLRGRNPDVAMAVCWSRGKMMFLPQSLYYGFRVVRNGWRKVPVREWVLKLVGEAGSCAARFGLWGWRAVPVSRGSGDPGGVGWLVGVFLLLLGMLLCVGCPVSGTYPTGF